MNTKQRVQYKKQISKQAIASVEWKDLRRLSGWQVAYNLILPLPSLILSWWFASQSLFVFACLCTYLFFASAFRQAHDGYHHSLGVSKSITTFILMSMSVFLLTSLHAIKATHMQHHRNPLGEDDIEGSLATLSWWQALIGGVGYRLAIYREGLRLSNKRNRIKSVIEFVLIGSVIVTALVLITTYILIPVVVPTMDIGILSGNSIYLPIVAKVAAYHLTVMFLANALVGIIAVWGVHHDAEDTIARTERNTLVNLLTFGLLYHVEHHIFPAVPTNNLPELAHRLDKALPQLTQNRVVPTASQLNNYIINTIERFRNKYSGGNDECPLRRHWAL